MITCLRLRTALGPRRRARKRYKDDCGWLHSRARVGQEIRYPTIIRHRKPAVPVCSGTRTALATVLR